MDEFNTDIMSIQIYSNLEDPQVQVNLPLAISNPTFKGAVVVADKEGEIMRLLTLICTQSGQNVNILQLQNLTRMHRLRIYTLWEFWGKIKALNPHR